MIRQADQLRDLVGLPTRVAEGDAPPVPAVRMSLAHPVPGAVVRLVPAVLVVVCAAVVGEGGLAPFMAAVAAVVATRRPDLPTAPVVAVLVGLWLFAQPDLLRPRAGSDDGLLVVATLVLCLHLLLRTTALAARVSWRGLVERAVLGRVARSVLGAQLVAQGVVLAVVWLRTGTEGAPGGQAWLRVLAVLAAAAVAVLVLPREWFGGSAGDGETQR